MTPTRIAVTAALLLFPLLVGAARADGPASPVVSNAEPVVRVEAATFLPQPAPFVAPINEEILTLAFSPDGTKLVTAGAHYQRAGQLKVWDVASGQALATVRRVPGVRSVAFSPDGQTLACGDFSNSVRLRDARTGEERAVLKGHTRGVNAVAFSPDGAALASAGLDHVVKLWDLKTNQERQAFRGHADWVFSVAFFRHGRSIVTGSRDKTARVWDVATGKETLVLKGHTDGVEMVAVSPDDRLVATAGWDQTIRLWDAATGREQAALTNNNVPVLAVTFSPDGQRLASAGMDGRIKVWDVPSRQEVQTLGRHTGSAWAVAFSPDGKTLASGGSDKTARLWTLADGKEGATLVASEFRPVLAVAYAPDGQVVGMATRDQTVQLRDETSGDVVLTLKGHAGELPCLAFSPDGRTVASGSADRTIRLWDRATGQEKLTLKGHAGAVLAVAFSPDGRRLASAGDDRTVRTWDPTSGKELAQLKGPDGVVRALAFAPDGRLAGGRADGTVRVWDPARPADPVTLKGHDGDVHAVAFASDGALASAGADGTVRLWDPAQGRERHTLKGHAGPVVSLAFAPSGRTLVSADDGATLVVWDPATGRQRQTLQGHQEAITAIAFHPQGWHLVGAGPETALRWHGADTTFPLATLSANHRPRFVAYSPAGDRLASGGEGGSVTLWAPSLAPARYPYATRTGTFWDACFTADGRTLALGLGTQVQLCDAVTGQAQRTLAVGEPVRGLAVSPDGKYLATSPLGGANVGGPPSVRLHDAGTGQPLAALVGHTESLFAITFAPDGKTLVTTAKDKTIRLWDVPSGKLRHSLREQGNARGVAFLPDGTLVTASWDSTICFWDMTAGRLLKRWQAGFAMAALAASPDGTLLAAAEGAQESQGPAPLRVWEVSTGKERAKLQGHAGRILALAFTPDGRGLVSVGGKPNGFGEICLWDPADGRRLATHQTPRTWLTTVAIHRDGKRLVCTSTPSLSLWDLELGRAERTWNAHTGDVLCGLFLDGGQTLATGGTDGAVKLWNVPTGSLLATFQAHDGAVRGLAVVPGGKTLFSAGADAAVRRWDVATFKGQGCLAGHTLPVNALAVSPDRRSLVSGAGDLARGGAGELIVWDLEANQPRQRWPGFDGAVESVAYSPDGSLLAAGLATGTLKVWDASTGAERATRASPQIRALAFSPDGKLLAAGDAPKGPGEPGPGHVTVWETAAWAKHLTLQRHAAAIEAVSFSPAGDTIVSAGRDGTIKLCTVPALRSPAAVAVARRDPLPIGELAAKELRSAAATDTRIRMLPELPGPTQLGPAWKRWLLGLEALGLVLTLAAGVWLAVRDRRRVRALAAAPAQSGAPPASVSLRCDGCGKNLKTRAELAGKKVKCPHCGHAAPVPKPVAAALPAPLGLVTILAGTALTAFVYGCSIHANEQQNMNHHLGAEYFNIARSLVAGEGFGNPFGEITGPTAWMPPVLPALLAGLLWLADGSREPVIVAVVLIQVHVLILTGLLVLALARQAAGRVGAGVAAAACLVALLCQYKLCFKFTHDCWIVLLALDLLVAGLCWLRPLGGWKSAAGWGVFGGLAALVNPIVGMTWGAFSLLLGVQQRTGARLAVALVAAGLTQLPWTVRNYLVFHKLIPVKSNAAYELYQSQCLQPDGLLKQTTFRTHPYSAAGKERQEYKALGEIPFLEKKNQIFWEAVRKDPEDFVERAATRFLAATLWYEPFDRNEESRHRGTLWLNRLFHPLPFLGLLVLLFTGIRERLHWTQWVVILTYLLYLLPYIVVSYYERYTVPLIPVKALLVAWAVDRLFSLWPRRKAEAGRQVVVVPSDGPAHDHTVVVPAPEPVAGGGA